MRGPSKEDIDQMFMYHPPTDEQKLMYGVIRESAKNLAYVILANTPPGPDQTAAIRKLRECVMTANAAVALEGKLG